ncbi:hypothetical protein T09_14524 [Trichinella sp. T9]|nr:hypothetical protein T09_14524 [Trichinella sp. T9]
MKYFCYLKVKKKKKKADYDYRISQYKPAKYIEAEVEGPFSCAVDVHLCQADHFEQKILCSSIMDWLSLMKQQPVRC